MEEIKYVSFKVSADLHGRFREYAKRKRRNFKDQILFMMEEAIRRDKAEKMLDEITESDEKRLDKPGET